MLHKRALCYMLWHGPVPSSSATALHTKLAAQLSQHSCYCSFCSYPPSVTDCNHCIALNATLSHLRVSNHHTIYLIIWPCNGVYDIRRYSAELHMCYGAAVTQCSIAQKVTSILLVVLPSAMCSAIRTPKLCSHALHANNKCDISHAVASCRHILDGFM